MQPISRIENMIESGRRRFKAGLECFYPAFDNNGINERNLTFQLAQAFCRDDENAHAFFEVPIGDKGKPRIDEHFDSFLFDDEIAIVVEAKRLYSSEKNDSLMADIERMRGHGAAMLQMFEEKGARPRKLYGLVIAEHWEVSRGRERQNVLEWWTQGTGNVEWDGEKYPKRWRYDAVDVHQYGAEATDPSAQLHWLYGYGSLPARP